MFNVFLFVIFLHAMKASIAHMTSENWKTGVMREVIKHAENEKLEKFWVGAGKIENNKLFLALYFLNQEVPSIGNMIV